MKQTEKQTKAGSSTRIKTSFKNRSLTALVTPGRHHIPSSNRARAQFKLKRIGLTELPIWFLAIIFIYIASSDFKPQWIAQDFERDDSGQSEEIFDPHSTVIGLANRGVMSHRSQAKLQAKLQASHLVRGPLNNPTKESLCCQI